MGKPTPKRRPPHRDTPEGALGARTGLSRSSAVAITLTLIVLLSGGLAHRSMTGWIQEALGEVLQPTRPLSTLPLRLGGWTGQDLPVDERIAAIANEDQSVNRTYQHEVTGRTLGLYIGYMGRPRTRMGHRPDVCYPGHGYEEASCDEVSVPKPGGTAVPALLYEFQGPQLGAPRHLVLVFYLVNGRFVSDPAAANDYNTRSPTGDAKNASYVARVQIDLVSSGNPETDQQLVVGFASQVIEPLLSLMPGSDAAGPSSSASAAAVTAKGRRGEPRGP